ncbi:TetR family transcriptional regulator [Actinomadura barringtoniae]|uniref:TetR family transcriptional regulator n=1 Tax=Actinomadura barringtoniae TaxID=1427535 RepID=A0A939PVM0_9ACTN|nr:TetR family transcriptional regulator [Actinomadura barringtoniae]MBO2455839.1 TetR family transcriptional regulator [Actinomadura barringtoniae]
MTSENRGAKPTPLSAAHSDLLDDYARTLNEASLAADTRRTYISRVRMYLAWLDQAQDFGPDPLSDPAARDQAVRAYRDHLLPHRSVRYSDNALAALDHFHIHMGLGRAAIDRTGVPKTEPRPRLGDDVRAVWLEAVDAWPSARDRLLTLVPLHAGLRIGEIVALDHADAETLAAHGGLAEPLRAWLKERETWPNTDAALFLNSRGGRLSVRGAAAVFNAVSSAAGLAGQVTADTFRTTPTTPTTPTPEPPRVVRRVPGGDSLPGRQQERRDRIVDAAIRLMAAVDYDRIQVRDVAERAGVALATLYRYFASKDHLFACALTRWASGFEDRLAYPAGASTAERVTAVYRRAARAFEGEPRVYTVLTHLESSRDERAAEIYQAFVRAQNRAFATALADLPADERDDVCWLMGAVLSEALRARMLGQLDMPGVYARIGRSAELLRG